MKLSIIVPTLDGEVPRSLRDAVDNRQDAELVVVKGVCPIAAARNEGLAKATGEYVAWVDSDDEVTGEWLPEIMQSLEDNPDIVDFDTRVIWVDSSRPGYVMRGGYETGLVPPGRYRQDYLRGKIGGQLWCKVFRRSLFDGLFFEGAQYEELAVMFELLRRVKSVRHIAKALYVYNRRSTGLSQCVSGSRDITRVIDFARGKPELHVGVCQMAADYLRHSAVKPIDVVSFVRHSLVRVLMARDVSLRIKVKCVLAALGK